MYKTFVRSHLDYYDIIYHEPAKSDNHEVSLTAPVEEIERVQYKAALALQEHGRVAADPNFMLGTSNIPSFIP